MYASAFLGVAALVPGFVLPPLFASIAGGLGVEAMGQLLDKITTNELSDEEILEEIRSLLNSLETQDLLKKDQFFFAYSRIRKNQMLLKEQNSKLLSLLSTYLTPPKETEIDLSKIQDGQRILNLAESAALAQNLAKLNQMYGHAVALQDSVAPHLRDEAKKLVDKIKGLRAKLRDDLGRASTIAFSEEHFELYLFARDMFLKNIQIVVDDSDLFSLPEIVSTPEFYSKLRNMYLANLRDLAWQRLHEASGLQATAPRKAIRLLQDTLIQLTKEEITIVDRVSLGNVIAQITHEVDRLNRAISP